MNKPRKARALGINHVALEVDDIDAALEFYGRLFEFELRGRSESMAFIDLGDQFLNFSSGRRQGADEERHFGLVVDDRQPVLDTLEELGIPLLPGPFKDFLDPWGNRIELIDTTHFYARCDKLLLTSDLDFVPVGIGGDNNVQHKE